MRAVQRAVGAIRRLAADLTPRPDSVRQLLQHLDCRIPVDASICDADALLQRRWTFRWYLLVALVNVRLDHDADDGILAFAELVADDLRDLGLVLVVLLGVACERLALAMQDGSRGRTMRAIDHHHLLLALLLQRLSRLRYTLLVKVGARRAATKYNKAVWVARSPSNRSQALLRHTHEMMLCRRRSNRIHRHHEPPVRAILEPHRE